MNVTIADPISVAVNATISLPFGTANNLQKGIENQAAIFVKRYLNSLTIGDFVAIQEIERQIKISSDFIKSINITSMTAGGVTVNRKEFKPQNERQYIVSGTININSVIIGASNY
jgi:general stress protein CsbA